MSVVQIPKKEADGMHMMSQLIPVDAIYGIVGGDPVDESMIESVRRDGILQPIRVTTEKGKKGYRLIMGRRRLAAAKAVGMTLIPATVDARQLDDLQVRTLALVENYLRSENFTQACRDAWAMEDAGMTPEEIALTISPAAEGSEKKKVLPKVKQLLRTRALLPELFEAVEGGQIKPWVAWNAARQPINVQEQLIEILNERGKVTPDDFTDIRTASRVNAGKTLDKSLFDDMPELDGEEVFDDERQSYGGFDASIYDEGDDDRYIEEFNDASISGKSGLPSAATPEKAPKVKMTRKDRQASVLKLLQEARKEMLQIKAPRHQDEADVLAFIEEGIDRLTELTADAE